MLWRVEHAITAVRAGRGGGLRPRLNAAAILLGSQGNMPVEATAQVLDALLDAPVSTGFVARAQERLADVLEAAGFDEAMRQALRAEPVLGADESPVNVVCNLDIDGQPAAGGRYTPCGDRTHPG